MRPIFTIHAGEYLVATEIEKKFRDLRVWIPSKDIGIDLLVTDERQNKVASTLDSVDWFNHRRLLEPIGYVPPAEYEARYYEQAAVA